MPQTARSHIYRLAWGKQSGQGTAQTTPDYETSVYSGSIKAEKTEEAYEVSQPTDLPNGYFRSRAGSMGTVELVSDSDAAPSLWAAHLGTDTKTGASDPYTHTLSRSDAKPLLTVFQMRPDIPGGTDRWERMKDGFVKSIELRANAGQPIRTYLNLMGTAHRFPVAAPTITNDRRIGAADTQVLTMIGSTLNLDLAATPSTTRLRNIESLVITSEYPNASWLQTDELTGRYLDLGPYRVGVSATVLFDSFAAYSATFFGSSTVTEDSDLSTTVVAGSGSFAFGTVDGDPDRALTISLPSLVWEAEMPDVDPSGGPVRMTLTAKVQRPASGDAISVVAKNGRSTAY